MPVSKADGYPGEDGPGEKEPGKMAGPRDGSSPAKDSDSGEDSAEEPQKEKVGLDQRLDRDMDLLRPRKQKAAPAVPVAVKTLDGATEDLDSGEDSAEEPQKEKVMPDRFDRDMDLLHQRLKQRPVPQHLAKTLDQSSAAAQVPATSQSAQEAEDEALAIQLQEDLLKETQDDAAIAQQLQADLEQEVVTTATVVTGTRPQKRPDLLAAASAVAAAREEERLAEAEAEDEEESWAEEEVEPTSSKVGLQIKVRVPEGCAPGDTLEVVSPTGDLVHVVIPPGHGPGSLLMVQVQNRPQNGPQNMLYSSLTDKHSLEQWEVMLQKLASGYSVIKVARNGKLYQRNFWLAGGSLRTNGRFSSGVDLRQLTGVFQGAVSQEFIKLRKGGPSAPRKSTSSIGSSLLRTFGANQKAPIEHPDPEEAGVVIIATGGRSFSLLFAGGSLERDGFAESITFAVQRLRQEMGRPCKF